MRRLLVASLVTVLLAFGGFFAVEEWRSDGPDAETTPTGSWQLELRPVNEAAPLRCGRPPYRPCAENGTITLTDAASTP